VGRGRGGGRLSLSSGGEGAEIEGESEGEEEEERGEGVEAESESRGEVITERCTTSSAVSGESGGWKERGDSSLSSVFCAEAVGGRV